MEKQKLYLVTESSSLPKQKRSTEYRIKFMGKTMNVRVLPIGRTRTFIRPNTEAGLTNHLTNQVHWQNKKRSTYHQK